MQKSRQEHKTPKWEAPRVSRGDGLPTMTPKSSGLPLRGGRRAPERVQNPANRPSSDSRLPVVRSSAKPPWDPVGQTEPLGPTLPPLFPNATVMEADSETSILTSIRRHIWTFAAITLAFWTGTATYLMLVPPVFEATTLLMVDTRGYRNEVEDLPRISSDNIGFGVSKIANQALILKSSTQLIEQTADQILALNGGARGASFFPILSDLPDTQKHAEIVYRLRNEYVDVIPQPNDDDEPDAITVTVKSTVPEEAVMIANLYARSYISYVADATALHFDEARQFYQGTLDKEMATVAYLDEQLHTVAAGNDSAMLEEEARQTLRQISDLRSKLDDTRIFISQQEALISSLGDQFQDLEPQLHAEQIAGRLDEGILQTNRRIAELELEAEKFFVRTPSLRGDPSPSVKLVTILTELNSLKVRVEELSRQYVDEIVSVGGIDLKTLDSGVSYMAQLRRRIAEERVDLSAAQARESAILNRLAQYEQRRSVIPLQTVDVKLLEKEHSDAARRLTELKKTMMNLEESRRSHRVFAQIVSPAVVPDKPTRSPMMLGMLGGILGLLLGVGAAFSRNQVDTRIFDPTDLIKLDLDLIGTVPNFASEMPGLMRIGKMSPFHDRIVSRELLALLKPKSATAQAVRKLQLRLSGEAAEMQTFVVTSAEYGTGKSLLAANFAVVLAQSGFKTLLIDADLYHPSVIRLFGLSDQAKFDLETCTFSDGLGVEAFSAALPNLYALSLTGPQDGTAEFYLSTNLVPLLERVRRHFDIIVIDAPPLEASTDALRLSQLGDQTILVARSKKTDSKMFVRTAQDIENSTCIRPLVVLNGYSPVPVRHFSLPRRSKVA